MQKCPGTQKLNMHVMCIPGCASKHYKSTSDGSVPGVHRDRFVAGPSNSVTRKELGALFDVIGTPSWADVECVQSSAWRSYLQKLPGRAPTLFRRLGFAGVH